jgi:hypothetical protein
MKKFLSQQKRHPLVNGFSLVLMALVIAMTFIGCDLGVGYDAAISNRSIADISIGDPIDTELVGAWISEYDYDYNYVHYSGYDRYDIGEDAVTYLFHAELPEEEEYGFTASIESLETSGNAGVLIIQYLDANGDGIGEYTAVYYVLGEDEDTGDTIAYLANAVDPNTYQNLVLEDLGEAEDTFTLENASLYVTYYGAYVRGE